MTDKLLKLYIEPSSRCNLACKMCFRNSWIGESLSDMEMSLFKKAIDSMPNSVEDVFFGGMGEPLMNGDIFEMVEYAANRGARTSLLTNGTMLTDEVSRNLLDRGLDKLWVSIDSFDEDEYESIRKNSNFGLVRSNIEGFNSERIRRGAFEHPNKKSPVELGLTFVAMKSNVAQLGRLKRFADEYGVNEINISNVSPTDFFSQSETLFSRVLNLELDYKISGNSKISLPAMDGSLGCVKEGIASLLGISLDEYDTGSRTAERRLRYCRFINDGIAFVRQDGEVSPCMALLHSGRTYIRDKQRTVNHHSFGNVGLQGLSEIWGSEEYAAFRARVLEFDFSPCVQCGGCDFRDENLADCYGNVKPTCGACLWSEDVLSCP